MIELLEFIDQKRETRKVTSAENFIQRILTARLSSNLFQILLF